MKNTLAVLIILVILDALPIQAYDKVRVTPELSGREPFVKVTFTRSGAMNIVFTPGTELQSTTTPSDENSWEAVEGAGSGSLRIRTPKEHEFFRAVSQKPIPTRSSDMFIPSDYDSTKKYPLVFGFHAFTQTAGSMVDAIFPLDELVDSEEFLFCTPQGEMFPNGGPAWNSIGDPCCESLFKWVNDVAYVEALVESIKENYSVDEDRVYSIGHSLGGGLTHALLCNLSHIFAAGICHAGTNWVTDEVGCRPEYPVHFLEIRSLTDGTVPWGATTINGFYYPSAEESIGYWAALQGCDEDFLETGVTLNIDAAVGGAETDVLRFENCQGGEIELWRRNRGGHDTALRSRSETSDLPSAILQWLWDHPKVR